MPLFSIRPIPSPRIASTIIFLLCQTCISVSAQEPPKLKPREAAAHIGEVAMVCGRVTNARFDSSSPGQPTVLTLGNAFPNPLITVLIEGENRTKFTAPPEETYSEGRICVRGRITEDQGNPRIEISDPTQIGPE